MAHQSDMSLHIAFLTLSLQPLVTIHFNCVKRVYLIFPFKFYVRKKVIQVTDMRMNQQIICPYMQTDEKQLQ